MEKLADLKFLLQITKEICNIGRNHKFLLPIHEVGPFKHYFSKSGNLKHDELDEYDGKFTRREILTRYLLISVVLDQGPDIVGVRKLLKEVITSLYRREIRILHRPLDFFREIGVSIDEILRKHDSVKKMRASIWAKENKSFPKKYNLFFTQSTRGIVSTKQVLDYAVHRWGVPLCVPLLLEKDLESRGKNSPQPLVDYLESFPSAEVMANQLKADERYGLGSAIGDKACHLFAKMYVSEFNLVKYKTKDPGWTGISYELPLDSNAGRVLFRSGFLFELTSMEDLKKWKVIKEGEGKGKTNYVRVTNLRNKRVTKNISNPQVFEDYAKVVKEFLKKGKPKFVEIQRVPNLIVYMLNKEGENYSIADFDNGLLFIGTNYCHNHEAPKCKECPINDLCKGYNRENFLITNYRT